jgi:hypothetical protein
MDPANNAANDSAIDAMLQRINGLASGEVPVNAPPLASAAPVVSPPVAPPQSVDQSVQQPAVIIPSVGQREQNLELQPVVPAADDRPLAPVGHPLTRSETAPPTQDECHGSDCDV